MFMNFENVNVKSVLAESKEMNAFKLYHSFGRNK